MNAITEIRRIEADLYRFMQTDSEAPRLMRDYLGDLLAKSHVPMDQYDETCGELHAEREKREQVEEDSKELRRVVENFRDSIQQTKFLPYDSAAFIALVDELVGIIQNSETDILIESSRILADLSSIESGLEEEASEKTPPEIQTPSPNPNPDQHHENQHIRIDARTTRRLPGFGQRAA